MVTYFGARELCPFCPGSSGGSVEEVTRVVEVTRLVESAGVAAEIEVTRIVEVPVEVTRVVEIPVEVEVEVTRIVEVEKAPPPIPENEVFFELEGSGSLVTENYDFGACNKAVWHGSVSAEQGNYIVNIWKANCTERCEKNLFNLAPYDGEVEGQSLHAISGGTYYFEFEHTPKPPTTWKLIGECQG